MTVRNDGHYIHASGNIFVGGDYFRGGKYDVSKQLYSSDPFVIEGHKLEVLSDRKSDRVKVAGHDLKSCSCDVLDISWLKSASSSYDISPNISDYVIVEVPCVVAKYPNRNQDAFGYKELISWRVPMSRMAYQTFIGKPTHQDHQNQNPKDAKGVILDAMMAPVLGKPHVKLLKAFDRSKDERLAKLVQKRDRIGHSMGALVERTRCGLPWCGFISDGRSTCEHVAGGNGKGRIIQGHLVYEEMLDFYFIESSSVEDPAYIVALSDAQHSWV
jgi:hypothetical protein